VALASNTRATDTILIISALHQGRRIFERRPRTGSVRTADDDNEAIRNASIHCGVGNPSTP